MVHIFQKKSLVQHPNYLHAIGCECDDVFRIRIECDDCTLAHKDSDAVVIQIFRDKKVGIITCHNCGKELGRLPIDLSKLKIIDNWERLDREGYKPEQHDNDYRQSYK